MLILSRYAFGIRPAEKRAGMSTFEATQPCGTAQLAGIKSIVRTACVITVLAAIIASMWGAISLVHEWPLADKGSSSRS